VAGTGAAGAPPPACYTVSFIKPVNLAHLSAADDKDANNCSNGFQYDVQISTNAPNGTDVQLFAGGAMLQMVQASGGQANFTNVQFASSGDTDLSIQFPSTMTCTDPTTKAKVTVDCSVPTCAVTKPIISPTHPALNGVPATQGGDRVSSTGSPYQAAFAVTTNIADNQTVALDINDVNTPGTVTVVTAHALGGIADFAGVALPPGATYQIQARCIDGNGVVGRSTKGSYPVDATAPDLTVSKPASGDFIGPGGITNGAFPVCGKTTATDAVNLDPALGARVSNFCAQVSGSPICAAATTVGVDTCVNVPCTGSAAFNINVTLTDAAGNPTTQVISGVTCSATTPTVAIISPVTDAPLFNDPSRHLLAANAPQPFRDQNGAVAGAQTDVIACASRAGNARLFAGHAGDPTLAQVGGTVVTSMAGQLDGCGSLGFVVKFLGVTLPESLMNANGSLATSTRLSVDVTDVSSSTGVSPSLDLWVDTTPPTISLTSPVGLCGSFHQASNTFDTSIVLATDTPNVSLTVTNGGTQTLAPSTWVPNVATFMTVSFNQGQSNLAAVATDAAGNATAMQPTPCTVTAGIAPVVIFTTPDSSNMLCASGAAPANCINDTDINMSGWQGSLTVQALLNGLPLTTGNITFTAGGAPLGTAPLDSNGFATLSGVTLFDGTVTIAAQTDNIPGNGVGTGTLTIVVDTGAPDAPTNLSAMVLDRRQTSFLLTWTAPGDHGQPVAGYEVRSSKDPIDANNFGAATDTPFTGTPLAPGQQDSIAVTDKFIENGYYFAIRAIDSAGNKSAVIATNAKVTAHFNTTVLSSGANIANEQFGYQSSGSGDVNGDGVSDLLVGAFTGQHAYLYLGTANGAPAAPSVTFESDGTTTSFGRAVSIIGDIDGDGRTDLAISDRATPGRVFIYKGRPTWTSPLKSSNADYVILADTSYNGKLFGFSMAALGDFNADGVDDFVIGVPSYGTGQIGRVVIVFGKVGFGSINLPDATNTKTIDGDSAIATPNFGYRVLGLGHFYSVTAGTTLIVGSPGTTGGTAGSEGRVYAFHGQGGPGASIPLISADHVAVGNALKVRLGGVLANLGPILGPLPSVGSGHPADRSVPTGSAWAFSGDDATGPFASHLVVYQTQNPTTNNGQAIMGGGISGSDQVFSLIGGDTVPDFVQVPQGGPGFAIIDGRTLKGPPALTSPVDSLSAGSVVLPFPANWGGTAETGAELLPDVSGDNYADFAISNANPGNVGMMVVYW
jgi:hypothetical protein